MAFGIAFIVLSTIAMVRMVGELRSGSPRWYRVGVLGLVGYDPQILDTPPL